MYPKIWQGFTEIYLKLEPRLALTWWHALCRSRWSTAREFRHLLASFNPQGRAQPEDVERFWYQHLTPQALVSMIEDLVTEGRLRRKQGTAIEEHIFAMLVQGRWK